MKRLLVSTDDSSSVASLTPVRVALVDDGRLIEYHFEEANDRRILGNVYLGRVVNVEPAIQAAFIDIGESRSAFVHVSDLHPAYAVADGVPTPDMLVADDQRGRAGRDGGRDLIQNVLRRGQPVLVQVTKETIGHKGPSVTTYLSIAGRYLVLMVGMSRAGVSKRITDEEQRDRLREIAASLEVDDNLGVIVRTAGEGRTRRELEKDLRHVKKSWKSIVERSHELTPPAILFEESDLIIRTVRDLYTDDVDEIVVDSEEIQERVESFLRQTMPRNRAVVSLHEGSRPLFDAGDLEAQVESIYDRKVALPSGGSLVIDETEALVAIDVNSGRSREQDDLEETAVLTNSEAAVEIARQLRLRDLGGVIVCDFIDMLEAENRREVERILREHLRRDRSKTWIARMSRFGLIEMTRQRLRPSKDKVGRKPCPSCAGRGTIRSPHLVSEAVFRRVRRELAQKQIDGVEVWAGAHLLEYLVNERRDDLNEIEDELAKQVTLHLGSELASDAFEIRIARATR